MRVLSIRQINLDFSDLSTRRPLSIPEHALPRASGIHQSDILRWIAVEKVNKLKRGERVEDEYPLRWAMGVMWEEFAFSTILRESVWQPGEVVVDGIAVNPDGLGEAYVVQILGGIVDESMEAVVDETKCTECKPVTTEADLLEKFSENWWVYQHQGRGYCYCYAPRVMRWTMLHYRGDWRGSGPVCMEYVVEFSDGDVEQTWLMQLRWKPDVEKELGMQGHD
jgi:hypothetical protein